ncbi:Uncharacterised protein [Bifidobacterium breve]|nr:Uncharacterised protein [Bifidobacterium breve]
MALEGDIALQREVNALGDERAHLIANEVAQATANDHSTGGVTHHVVTEQAPRKVHTEQAHVDLWPHEFRTGQILTQ